jgi:GNAT superfamily N-acetyltransferase
MYVRAATADELPAVRNVLDGALLEVGSRTLEDAIDSEGVLVAVRESDGADEIILGALVLVDAEILAIAVRKGRRDRGIGTALVEAAAERHGRLTAEFHSRVRPFWVSVGFEVEPLEKDERFRGYLSF